MSSEGAAAAVGPRLHRLFPRFDPESAAMVTILLGLFQVLLSVPLAFADQSLPKSFVLPLLIGILIVVAGSFTIANERNSSRRLLQGCAYSNVVGVLGTLLAFCLYCYSLSKTNTKQHCVHAPDDHDYMYSRYRCPENIVAMYRWCLTLLLLLYDIVALVMHCLLSASALKTLKTD